MSSPTQRPCQHILPPATKKRVSIVACLVSLLCLCVCLHDVLCQFQKTGFALNSTTFQDVYNAGFPFSSSTPTVPTSQSITPALNDVSEWGADEKKNISLDTLILRLVFADLFLAIALFASASYVVPCFWRSPVQGACLLCISSIVLGFFAAHLIVSNSQTELIASLTGAAGFGAAGLKETFDRAVLSFPTVDIIFSSIFSGLKIVRDGALQLWQSSFFVYSVVQLPVVYLYGMGIAAPAVLAIVSCASSFHSFKGFLAIMLMDKAVKQFRKQKRQNSVAVAAPLSSTSFGVTVSDYGCLSAAETNRETHRDTHRSTVDTESGDFNSQTWPLQQQSEQQAASVVVTSIVDNGAVVKLERSHRKIHERDMNRAFRKYCIFSWGFNLASWTLCLLTAVTTFLLIMLPASEEKDSHHHAGFHFVDLHFRGRLPPACVCVMIGLLATTILVACSLRSPILVNTASVTFSPGFQSVHEPKENSGKRKEVLTVPFSGMYNRPVAGIAAPKSCDFPLVHFEWKTGFLTGRFNAILLTLAVLQFMLGSAAVLLHAEAGIPAVRQYMERVPVPARWLDFIPRHSLLLAAASLLTASLALICAVCHSLAHGQCYLVAFSALRQAFVEGPVNYEKPVSEDCDKLESHGSNYVKCLRDSKGRHRPWASPTIASTLAIETKNIPYSDNWDRGGPFAMETALEVNSECKSQTGFLSRILMKSSSKRHDSYWHAQSVANPDLKNDCTLVQINVFQRAGDRAGAEESRTDSASTNSVNYVPLPGKQEFVRWCRKVVSASSNYSTNEGQSPRSSRITTATSNEDKCSSSGVQKEEPIYFCNVIWDIPAPPTRQSFKYLM